MTMKNKMDELGKMEGITEKEKGNDYYVYKVMTLCISDPEEFLNMLFKHMLRVPAFISIRWIVIVLSDYELIKFLDVPMVWSKSFLFNYLWS